MGVILEASEEIARLAQKHESALVAFSGGKDSLVVMDMARRQFKRVVGVFMYFVPGLQCDAERLKIAESWGIDVIQFPHFGFLEALRTGCYCWNGLAHDGIPDLSRSDIYNLARYETGIKVVLTGIKASDSMSRRNAGKRMTSSDVYHPIIKWRDFDVLAYCGLHKIPLPITPKGVRSSGVDLKAKSLIHLLENYPDDFQRLLKWFPFAESVIYREYWHWGYADPTGYCTRQESKADPGKIDNDEPVREVHASEDPSPTVEECDVQPAIPVGEGKAKAARKSKKGGTNKRGNVEQKNGKPRRRSSTSKHP